MLKLIVTDGCAGLHAALDTVYPYVPRQRCWVHKLRNVANSLKRSQQEECMTGARAIYLSETRRDAVRAYWTWAQRWRSEAPKAVASLERDLEPLLSFLACPRESTTGKCAPPTPSNAASGRCDAVLSR